MPQRRPPPHPGAVLRDEFLAPSGLTAYALAKAIGVPPQRVTDITGERRGISADSAARFGRYFFGDRRQGAAFWMKLQARYDLEVALVAAGDAIDAIVPRAGTKIRGPIRLRRVGRRLSGLRARRG